LNFKWFAAMAAALIGFIPAISHAQTTILSTQAGGGALPAGWTSQNNVTTNAIDRGTFWLVDAGATKDFIVSSDYDLSAFNTVTINVNVATFGPGANNALLIEYSTNSGTSWNPTTFTTPTPTSATYITGGPIAITGTFTSTTRLRFSANGTSGRGVRIQQLGITATSSGPDLTGPVVQTYNPAVAATNVAAGSDLVLTFDEPITTLTGDIEIKDGTNTVTIPVTDAAQVTVSGTTVTINPTADLALGTAYHVLIDPGTFEDAAGNDFLGITSDTTWTFTTIGPDVTGPAVVSVSPLNGAINVDPAVNPVITYDENLILGTGNILIKRVSDNSTVSTLSVTDEAQVLVFNNQAFLTPSAPLPVGTTFYIEVPLGAFEDALGNESPAFGGSGVWSFTTPIIPSLTSAGPYTEDFASFTSATTLPSVLTILPPGWSVSGPDLSYDGNWGTGTNGGFRGNAGVFGYQHTSSTDVVAQTLTLLNDSGVEITELTVAYTGKRINGGATGTIARFPSYTVTVAGQSVPALSFGRLEGTLAEKSASVTGLSIAPGTTFTIVWTSDRDTAPGASGSSQQVGISDVNVSIGSETFPPTIAAVNPDFSALTNTSVSTASEVVADGGSTITERGFVFSLTSVNSNPEIGGTGVTSIPDDLDEVGPYSVVLSGLTPASQYSIRSYATNAEGTSYSGETSVFTLANPPSFVTSYSQPFDNFNGTILTGTLPAGWSVTSSGGLNGFAGTWAPATSSGGLLGNVDTPNGVLGYQHVGTSGLVTASLTLTNDTGAIIDELYVAYTGRVNRVDQTREPSWTVSLDGSPVTALDYSTSSGVDESKFTTITGLSIAPGATFTLTWVSDGNIGTGGGRRQIGIADVFVGLEAPPAGGYTDWASTNVGGDPANVDTDGDGVPNGVEYFMGETGSTFTANPSPDATGTVTWVRDPSATGVTFKVRTSPDLQTWTDVELTDPALTVTTTSVSYALPTATAGPLFVRLEVTVPPAP
jgi:hypothetical protein